MKKKILISTTIIFIFNLLLLLLFANNYNNKYSDHIINKQTAKIVKLDKMMKVIENVTLTLKIYVGSESYRNKIFNFCEKFNIDYRFDDEYCYFNSLYDKVKIQYLLGISNDNYTLQRYVIIKYKDKSNFLYYLPMTFYKEYLKNYDTAICKDILTDNDLTDEAIREIKLSYLGYGNIDESKFKDFDDNITIYCRERNDSLVIDNIGGKYVKDPSIIAYLIYNGCDLRETYEGLTIYNY